MGQIRLEDLVKKPTAELQQDIMQAGNTSSPVVETVPTNVQAVEQNAQVGLHVVPASVTIDGKAAEVEQAVQTVTPSEVQAEQVPAKVATKKVKDTFDKAILKGAVPATTELKPEMTFTVGEKTFKVLSAHTDSNRVHLSSTDPSYPPKFSVSISFLNGTEVAFPYSKGDVVRYKDADHVVAGLNPASMNVVLKIDGKAKLVKVTSVTLVSKYVAPAETPEVNPTEQAA